MASKMFIKEVRIENFKCFEGKFTLKLNEGLNILVGDNEAGKSTILEAIHIALTGLLNGHYLRNELTQYLFNNNVVAEYIENLRTGDKASPPHILIEIILGGNDLAIFEGDGNSINEKECGLSLKIAFNEKYQNEYEEFIKAGNVKTLPIEYYDVFWTSFARENITARSIPLKSAMIDSSSSRYQNGSDIYISRIVKDFLEQKDIISVSQAHRKMRDVFIDDKVIEEINKKLKEATAISSKDVKLSVELSTKNAWENSLMTYFNDVPFHHIGKGEQCIVKTNLALSHDKSQEANILLLEEPENHLSHSKLNQLIHQLKSRGAEKQIIISTHSSFVANKLGLKSLILLNDKKTLKLDDLKEDTKVFFEKLSGYDTLRLILCEKAILVEGDSDELIIQKAYRITHDNKLPIEDRIDVISVGTAFLRFLEVAEKIRKKVVVVTDNDGDTNALREKYADYLDPKYKDFIKICFDEVTDSGNLKIGEKVFNYNTLEPKIAKVNSVEVLNEIFDTEYGSVEDLHKYMRSNKTDCALKIFESEKCINFPQYILDAVE